ncbi:FixH family protein [Crateriforma spongiae]|uniref:FixH family protein n=1 Tax=Crateriforma spongiae TaxID=2724528 RepID=UPI001448272D|nr:FixH family protein [Crateriforma spongiae]
MVKNDANSKAAWRWGSMVVALLTLQVALGVVAIFLATGDRSVAVVPDYYQKALDWDKQAERKRTSEKLGWTFTVAEIPAGQSGNGLMLKLLDADDQPVAIQTGTVSIYHHARAGDVLQFSLDESMTADSPLAFTECVDRGGWWQVEIDVTDDSGARYVESRQVLLQGPASSEQSS